MLASERTTLEKADFEILVSRGGDDARAGIFALETLGALTLIFGARSRTEINLGEATRQKVVEQFRAERRLKWQCFYAVAGARMRLFELLGALVELVETTPMSRDGPIDYYLNYALRRGPEEG